LRKLSTAAKIVISALILLFLFQKANLQKGIQNAGNIDYLFILASVALIVLAQLARAFRLAVMLFGGSAREQFRRVLRIQMVSFLPGLISPAKIGEAAKIYMLQNETSAPLSRATACFVAERALDMLLLAPLAVAGLSLFLGPLASVSLRRGGLAVIVFAAACVVAGAPVGMYIAKRKGITASDIWRVAAPSNLAGAAGLTVLYWGLVFLEVWCFCKAALLAPALWQTALIVPPALLSSLLPVTFSGFGVREAALVFLLRQPAFGASYNQAILVSLLYILFGLGIPALMGLCYWMLGKKHVASQD
jgi:hypothetical protein